MNPVPDEFGHRDPRPDDTAGHGHHRGGRAPHSGQPLAPIELVTLVHVGAAAIFAAWAFGGNAAWSRTLLASWSSLSVFIIIAAIDSRHERGSGALRIMLHPLRWLWPLAVFNVVVLVSACNPSFREIATDTGPVLVRCAEMAWLPGSARPGLTLRALWLFDGTFLTCFNLALVIHQRRALRGLLLVLGASALALSIFGTFQKFAKSDGLYFGLVKSPNPAFFASFIYHNHWGAFILLTIAACLGLVWHYSRRSGREYRNFWHSPAFVGLVLVFFLVATIPLSTSRSSTLLAIILLGAAFLHWTARLVRQRRTYHESAVLPVAGACLALTLAGAAIFWLGWPVIERRLAQTQDQVAQMRAQGSIGGRAVLYRDTIRMARDRLWFGWGMGSFHTVFFTYNTQDVKLAGFPITYADAHSDWLQSVAEVGLVGTGLLGLLGVVPLLALRRRHFGGPVPAYLFGGCGLVLLYAWIEFPFGNPAVVLTWWLCFFVAVRYVDLASGSGSAPDGK
jgi:O-antigen ligase